jgi:hypothetical protein
MHTGRQWGILGHFLAALTCMLALAATGVANGTPIPSASQIMGAGHNVWTRDCKWCAWRGSELGASNDLARGVARARAATPVMTAPMSYASATLQMALSNWNSVAAPTDASGILLAGIAFVSTNNVSSVRITGPGISGLETGVKWRSSIAGSPLWSRLIRFSSSCINLRLPLN